MSSGLGASQFFSVCDVAQAAHQNGEIMSHDARADSTGATLAAPSLDSGQFGPLLSVMGLDASPVEPMRPDELLTHLLAQMRERAKESGFPELRSVVAAFNQKAYEARLAGDDMTAAIINVEINRAAEYEGKLLAYLNSDEFVDELRATWSNGEKPRSGDAQWPLTREQIEHGTTTFLAKKVGEFCNTLSAVTASLRLADTPKMANGVVTNGATLNSSVPHYRSGDGAPSQSIGEPKKRRRMKRHEIKAGFDRYLQDHGYEDLARKFDAGTETAQDKIKAEAFHSDPMAGAITCAPATLTQEGDPYGWRKIQIRLRLLDEHGKNPSARTPAHQAPSFEQATASGNDSASVREIVRLANGKLPDQEAKALIVMLNEGKITEERASRMVEHYDLFKKIEQVVNTFVPDKQQREPFINDLKGRLLDGKIDGREAKEILREIRKSEDERREDQRLSKIIPGRTRPQL